MLSADLPSLVSTSTSSFKAVASAGNALYFNKTGSTYNPALFNKDTFASDGSGGYLITQSDGTSVDFYGFGSGIPTAEQGQMKSTTDADGNTTSTTYNSSGQLTATSRNDGTTTESYVYSYISSGTNAGLVSSVALERGNVGGSLSVVQQVAFTYYGTGESFGNAGELKDETLENASGTSLGTTYFRYYTSAEITAGAVGYVGGLQYQLNPQSYARVVAAGYTPETATEAQIAPYADQYYQYDSSDRVTETVVQGAGCSCTGSTGEGTFTYSYSSSGNANGPNSWATATTETLPDGNQNIVYSNAAGQVMLSAFNDISDSANSSLNGKLWITYYQYDSASREILAAQPSAVTITSVSALSSAAAANADIVGYNASTGAFAYLSSSSGLINLTNYGSSTTATSSSAGNVAGYLQNDEIQNGYSGTPILLDSTQYIAHTGGSVVYQVATSTVYRNTGGSGGETTSVSYTWFSGTNQIQSETVSAPVISSGQNGPGSADVTTTYFDSDGRAIWTKDGDGYLNYTAYDNATGQIITSITDVNTSMTSEFTALPSGWSTPTGGGLNLVTTDVVDSQGRVTKMTSPNGNITYIVYDDPDHEVRVYPGWNATTGTTTGPTEVSRQDWPGSYTETLTMSANPAVSGSSGSYVPTGTESISGVLTLSRSYLDQGGRDVEDDAYFNLSGLTYSTTTHIGTLGTNYYATAHGFDEMGRQDLLDDANGTITITKFDSLGRPTSIYVGTNDSGFWTGGGSSNMTLVEQEVYDGNAVGDGNLTEDSQFPSSGSGDHRNTLDAYDWRDRLVASKQGDQLELGPEDSTTYRPLLYYVMDNLGEVTSISSFDGDGITLSTTAPSSSLLRGYVVTSYDDQGREFEQQQYEINQSSGAVSTYALTTNMYYDHRGDTIASYAPGIVTKDQYDGARRVIVQAQTDGAAGTTWPEAGSLSGDHVLIQTLMTYDADSNAILATTKDVFNTDTTDTGALGNPTTGPYARVSYTASYYDVADRPIAGVNVGTNGGSAYTRPSSAPSSSATVLVTAYHYNSAGWNDLDTDPKGIVTNTSYDALGRPTQVIAAYNASVNSGLPTNSANQTTSFTYDGLSNILTQTAVMPTGTTSQTTTYAYGVTASGGSAIADNDLLATITQPGGSDTKTFTYNALGQTLTMTDANGTTHTYTYDVLGRETSDAVTTLGSGVDGTVRRITTTYNALGEPYLLTSYSAVSGGSVVNQVEDIYNGLGQLTGEYQAVSGSVNTSTTPEVQYAYTEMSGGQNNSRITSMTYPNGRAVNYVYNSGIDSSISRLSAIVDASTSTTLESYSYLGLGTIVAWNHPQTGVNLTYIQQSGDTAANTDGGDQYTGLDRFGRVIDQNWLNTSTSSSDVRYQYGYDQNGNVLYRNDLVESALSELYHANSSASGDNSSAYDNLGRLTGFARGVLSASGNNGTTLDTISSASSSQSWSYDALGNQVGVTTNGTTVTQGFNTEDQKTSTTSGSTPTYDSNGNSLTSAGFTYVYNAWNMIVGVSNTATSAAVASYAYDALGRRIVESYSGGSTNNLYYDANWQVIEERQGGTSSSNVHYQYVMGATGNLILRDTYSSGTIVSTARLYALSDANGDVTALTNTNGTVVERYEYSPYGAVTVLTASGSPVSGNVSSYGWQYLFQGGRQDSATGLYVFEHRDYDSNSGTWMQRDPMGLATGDENLYRFVGNSPSDLRDPTGYCAACNSRDLYQLEKTYNDLLKWYNDKVAIYNADLATWYANFPSPQQQVGGQVSVFPPGGAIQGVVVLQWNPGWNKAIFDDFGAILEENWGKLRDFRNLLNVLRNAILKVCKDSPILPPGGIPDKPSWPVKLPVRLNPPKVPTQPIILDPKNPIVVDPSKPDLHDLPPLPESPK